MGRETIYRFDDGSIPEDSPVGFFFRRHEDVSTLMGQYYNPTEPFYDDLSIFFIDSEQPWGPSEFKQGSKLKKDLIDLWNTPIDEWLEASGS